VPARAAADPVTWFPEQYASSGFGADSVCDGSLGNLHLVHAQDEYALHAVFSAGGSQALNEQQEPWWGENQADAFGPAVAFGPGDEVHLVWKSPSGKGFWDSKYSRRSSGTWGLPVLLIGGASYGWAAQAAADGDGVTVAMTVADGDWPAAEVRTFRLAGGALAGDASAVLPARSDDRVDVVAGPAEGERHLFSGVPDESGSLWYAHSDDGGANWDTVGDVRSPSCSGGRVGQPDAAVGPKGTLHLVYGCSADSERGGGASVRHATFSGSVPLSDEPVTTSGELQSWTLGHGIARVAVTGTGVVVVAYLLHAAGALRAVSSDDGGATWHPAQELATVGGAADGRDAPTISALNASVYVSWGDGNLVHMRRGTVPPPLGDDDDATTPEPDDDDDDDDATSPPADDDSAGADDDAGWADDGGWSSGCCTSELAGAEGTPGASGAGGARPGGFPVAILLGIAILLGLAALRRGTDVGRERRVRLRRGPPVRRILR
jgi:hypothetical protein